MVKDASQNSSSRENDLPKSDALTDKTFDSGSWPLIVSKDKIPGWLRDNDYNIMGHPMPTYSYAKSYKLRRCLHMETMNIWTHFLGSAALVATGVALYRYARLSGVTFLGDKIAFGSSIAGATICFGLSATFYTLRSHSYNVHHFWGKMDILGICILALGGGVSATYYALYDNLVAQRIYWSLDLLSAIGGAITLFDTGGGGNKMRTLRGGVFSVLAISAILPIIHSVASLGWGQACFQIGAQYFLGEVSFLLIGVCLFVGRIPERFRPGYFDIWGHSHQLFHSCSVIATFFRIAALTTSYKYRHRP